MKIGIQLDSTIFDHETVGIEQGKLRIQHDLTIGQLTFRIHLGGVNGV